MIVRALTLLLIGLALVAGAFVVLDVDLNRRIVGGFVLLPLGALLIAIGIGVLARRYVESD